MKANIIKFDRIKARWDIMKMTSAYIQAEKVLINQSLSDQNIFNDEQYQNLSTTTFVMDQFGNSRQLSPKEILKAKLDAFEIQGAKLLEEEKYELFAELKEIYEKYKQEYDRL